MRRLLAVGVAATMMGALGVPTSNAWAAEGPYDPFFASPAAVADFGANTRPFGVAAGDYDGDGKSDMVVGRTTGNVAFVKGNGDGTFAAPATFAWKQAFFNAWSFAPADVNVDGLLDVVWSASAPSQGCSVAGTGCVVDTTVNDGDVRAWLGNGNGTFAETSYVVSGVRHNAGILLADVGTDAGSVTAGDIDGDGDVDVVAGALEGVRLLRNEGVGAFTLSSFDTSGTYFAATTTQNSPWGLALGDADGDGDRDLWVGDRALYVYLYRNDGAGNFTLTPGNIPGLASTRPNVYLRHDSYRAAVGYTPSLASADVNGDGKADLFVGLQSGTQTPATNVANDGVVLLDISKDGSHTTLGPLGDLGSVTRGLQTADVNGDGATDVLGATYEGKVSVLRQLPPRDADGDGISDYVDNAPNHPNAPRIDMNTDGSLNARDQLDNDFDTVLGDPEVESTWLRAGDPADPDDDNDAVPDESDNCAFAPNPDQSDVDLDQMGDACDPLDNRDEDGDGVPTGPSPGDPLFAASKAAAARWASGQTHFIIRIDALGRIFQNEFTQTMNDAAILTSEQWTTKCWENYGAGDPPDPCGTGEGTAEQTLTLGGGKDVPTTLITIPKQLWTDAPVIDWINDRNDNANFDLGMHATYHVSNTTAGDWASLTDRNFFSCELCGLSPAENVELLTVGKDTLLGNYANKWVAESGATSTSPKIDWTAAANPLLSYAPPYNADDTAGRQAAALLGFKAHSSSVFEEGSSIFTPEGSHHEAFDQFGMFHTSADLEFDPIAVPDGSYDVDDRAVFANHLAAETQPGELNTWLIEEVEWSGRPCNELDRIDELCDGGSNRENNTVYGPRWEQWLQLLDYVKDYPGGVAMTMAEVALAKGFDNAPTVPNADQADADADGIGDVVEDVTLVADSTNLSRNQPGELSATLTSGAGLLADQQITFAFDADGNGVDESYSGMTNSSGTATVSVTPTRPVGPASFAVSWTDGRDAMASATGSVVVTDATTTTLAADSPATGQVGDTIEVAAMLSDSDGAAIPGEPVTFTIGNATGTGVTDGNGTASVTLVLLGPAGEAILTASFAGTDQLGPSSVSVPFVVAKEHTVLGLSAEPGPTIGSKDLVASLTEADGMPLAGRTIRFTTEVTTRNVPKTVELGTAVTDGLGVARLAVPNKYLNAERTMVAEFAGDADFLGSSGVTTLSRR